MENIVIVQDGEDILQLAMRRDTKGLRVRLKAHPCVEEFMKELGDGNEPRPVQAYGRNWYVSGDSQLMVYDLARVEVAGNRYRLDLPGKPLEVLGSGQINLSFMRIAGISSPAGVEFWVKGAHPIDNLKAFRDTVLLAVNELYNSYLKPVEFEVVVTARKRQEYGNGVGIS